jgi:hypothetical protein
MLKSQIDFRLDPPYPMCRRCRSQSRQDNPYFRSFAWLAVETKPSPPNSYSAIAFLCQAVTGHEYAGSPSKHLVKPAPDLMSRLLKLHGMVDQLAKTMPDILSLPEVARALEQELIFVMIRCRR